MKAVKALRLKHGMDNKAHLFSKCTKDKYSAYLQYKKKPGQTTVPKELDGHRQQ